MKLLLGNLVFGLVIGLALCDCPDGWTRFENSCYLFGHDDMSHLDAERFCAHFKEGHLVNIETELENKFVRSYLSNLKNPNHWIGLSDQVVEGIWNLYPSEERASYLDWGSQQPNNAMVSNCAAIWASFQYHWVDEPCTYKYKPVCELKMDRRRLK